jgi:hypothetical protein
MAEKCSFSAGPRGPLSPPDGTSWSWSISLFEILSSWFNSEIEHHNILEAVGAL